MPRKRVLSPSSIPRYRGKLKRLYAPTLPDEASLIVAGMEQIWNKNFGEYSRAWYTFRETYGKQIPRGLWGLTRSCLFKMIYEKARRGDAGIREVADHFTGMGLPGEVVKLVEDFVRGFTE
jgi:hypothetical protein